MRDSSRATDSRASESAHCTTTSARRSRLVCRPAEIARPPSASASAVTDRSTPMTGASPAAPTATIIRATTNAASRQSVRISSVTGRPKSPRSGTNSRAIAAAVASARTAPRPPIIAVSIASSRAIRPARAPRAARTAISRERSVARARSRLATFAHATTSTSSAAPSSSINGCADVTGSPESPCRPSATVSTLGRARPTVGASALSTRLRSAAAASRVTPGRSRPMSDSQLAPRRSRRLLADGSSRSCFTSGIHTLVSRPMAMPRNGRAAMPTTANGSLLMTMVSAAKRDGSRPVN